MHFETTKPLLPEVYRDFFLRVLGTMQRKFVFLRDNCVVL
jgi:hypothetical protein